MSKKMLFCGVALGLLWLTSPTMAADVGKGNILFEYFTDIGGGTAISDLTSNPKFPNSPDISEWATSFLSRVDWADNAGARARGYLYPPQDGDYTFWVAGDDACELWLSTDDTAAKVAKIAEVTGWTGAQDWNNGSGAGGPNMKSKPISLKAGQKYYIEALEKEGGGGDSVGVAWGGPGIGAGPVLVDGKYLAPFIRSPEPLFLASNPNPADGAVNVAMALMTWKKGAAAASENVYFGTDKANLPLVAPNQANPVYFSALPLDPGVQYYWRIDDIGADGTVYTGNVWKFMGEPTKDYAPSPADGAKGQAPGLSLSWQAGKDAAQHQVFFGLDLDAVTKGAASVDQGKVTVLTFATGGLRSSTTYYWRVDVVKKDGSTVAGDVWSFSTVDAGPAGKVKAEVWLNIGSGTAVTDLTSNARYSSGGAPDQVQYLDSWLFPAGSSGGSDWADNYGDRETGWLVPPETGDYTFWCAGDDLIELWLSTDGSPTNAKLIAQVDGWTDAMDWDGATGAGTDALMKSAAQHLVAGQKYYMMTLHKEGGGGDSVGVAWQGGPITARTLLSAKYVDGFYLPPLTAFNPSPADGAQNTAQTLTMTWSAGDKAQKHDVYLGTDKAAVAAADNASPLFKGSQSTASFDVSGLDWGATYYWRVDEVNPAEAGSPWKGPVWTFTTANFFTVDDMESYNDDDNRIYDAWVDGVADGKSGSVVGYDVAPFAEQTIVHGGKQSMPFQYDNSGKFFFSEATQTFASPEDWTINGVTDLNVWVRGNPAPTPVAVTETGGKMTLSGDGTDIWNNSDDFTYAYKTLNGNGSMVARVVSIGPGTNTWAKGGVMIRDSLNGGSTFVNAVVTPDSTANGGNGAGVQWRTATDGGCGNTNSAAPVGPPYWVKVERTGDNIVGSISADGKAWTVLSTQTIAMTNPVYIGICVTSHQSGEVRTINFDSITSAGGVTGAWQGAAISSPAYNDAASMYLIVEDNNAKPSPVIVNATAVNSPTWANWKIPLSSLTGVNLSKVKKLTIGVGDRKATAADGTGQIYIDDILLTKP